MHRNKEMICAIALSAGTFASRVIRRAFPLAPSDPFSPPSSGLWLSPGPILVSSMLEPIRLARLWQIGDES
jgi:hypothetical protein